MKKLAKWLSGALAIGLLCASPSFAQSGEEFFTEYKGRQILQVKIYRDGALHAADREVSLAELDKLLEQLAERKGSVWYYREGPETEESNEQADKVIALIIKHRTPVCLSETVDYESCKT